MECLGRVDEERYYNGTVPMAVCVFSDASGSVRIKRCCKKRKKMSSFT